MTDQVTLDNTIGAAFLGGSATCLLCGIMIVQTQLYYRNFSKDWIVQRISVAFLVTLATFNLLFTLHSAYFYLIVNFGNLKGLNSVAWSFKLQLVINALTVILVQGLYVLRIWKLGRHVSRFWPALVISITACVWAFGFFVVLKSCSKQYFSDFNSMRQIIYATFAFLACIDVIIASAFCYFLNWCRSSFVGTDNKIFAVMRYMLIAGFLTSACSLCTLIAAGYAAMPHNMIFIGINSLLPNLYINSYVAMLNARKSMNEQETLSVDVSHGRVLDRRPGLSLRTDDGYLHPVDGKMSPGGDPLSATRYTPTFSNKYDLEQDAIQTLPWHEQQIPTPVHSPTRVGNTQGNKSIHRIHRIDERQSRVFPLWVSRRIPMCHPPEVSEHGGPVHPAGGAYNDFATGSPMVNTLEDP